MKLAARKLSPCDVYVESMKSAGRREPDRLWTFDQTMPEVNPFEERVSYLSSVVVVPRSTGTGYQVYQTPVSARRDASLSDYLDSATPVSPAAAARSPEWLGLGIPFRYNPIKAVAPTVESAASTGTNFSKNIGNPVMQKKVHGKMIETKSRVEMFLSSQVGNGHSGTGQSDAAQSSDQRKISSTQAFFRKLSPNKTSVRPPLKDINSNLTDSSAPTHKRTPSQISPPLPAHPGQSSPSVVTSASSSSRPQQKTTTSSEPPKLRTDEIATFHESLSREYRRVDRWYKNTNSPQSVDDLDELKQRIESSQKKLNSIKAQQTPAVLKDMLSNFRNKLKPKKLDISPDMSKDNKGAKFGFEGKTALREHDANCGCKGYHCHRFSGQPVNSDLEARKEKRQELILRSGSLQEEARVDSLDDPRNIFWMPSLSFHAYKHGDRRVSFSSLWPKYKELRELLQNSGIQQTLINNDTINDVSMLACTCGPVQLLQCLVELELIRIDQILENGSGLLHLSVLAHNLEAVHYLMAAKISPKLKDVKGLTADQVCFNPTVRRQLAPRYLLNRDMSRDKILLKPSLQDKDAIFRLAAHPRHFVDIQKKLQTLDFNVNTECDNNGDFLLHITVRKGLSQLPLLMALVNIQKADIELGNADGMTPLMLAASVGNCVLCDVLICLFGADPNKRNPQSGRGSLHYAAEGNHRKTVEVLMRRGTDINMEDHDGLRADDVPACTAVTDDCKEIIIFHRHKRLEMLRDLVRQDEVDSSHLIPSDLCVVDGDENTLIMMAAALNRPHSLDCMLEVGPAAMNAQHSRSGMTALAMAAALGHAEAVTVLLRHKVCPTIADMAGFFPLHHAVLNNHENVVDTFLEFFPETYVGLYKALHLCKKTSLHTKLKLAWERRQEEIVTPKLLGCVLNGDSEELFLLLDEGDNINPKSGTGNWPLYLAVENGHLDVLKLLFEKGGDIRKQHPTTGATTLHVAAKMGHQNIVSFLLQYCSGVAKNVISSPYPLTSQERSSRSDSYPGRRRKLLDINAMNKDNKTALQLAAEKGFSRIVSLLLDHGATSALLDCEGNLITCPQFEGVRMMIENHRQQHVAQVVRAIEDKTKRSLFLLQDVWLPKFDHNLRTKDGSTPLMIAAESGKEPIIKFLLGSAVYIQASQFESDSNDSDSDADSGVLDPTSETREDSKNEDDFLASSEAISTIYTNTSSAFENKKRSASVSFRPQEDLADSSDFHTNRLSRMVRDANRPKGLSIFHDGLVSHVCAMNLNDGTNVLHRSLRFQDAPNILNLFLEFDPAVLNMQDDLGETVLHTACRLKRKKSVELLLARSDLDVNVRTFDGHLPEEVTSSKAIRKLVEKTRSQTTQQPSPQITQTSLQEASICGSEKTGSFSVNFEKIQSQYENLKKKNNLNMV